MISTRLSLNSRVPSASSCAENGAEHRTTRTHGVYKVLVRYDHIIHSVIESRHVTSDESRFPGAPGVDKLMDDGNSNDNTSSTNNSDSGSDDFFHIEILSKSSDRSDVAVEEDVRDTVSYCDNSGDDFDVEGYTEKTIMTIMTYMMSILQSKMLIATRYLLQAESMTILQIQLKIPIFIRAERANLAQKGTWPVPRPLRTLRSPLETIQSLPRPYMPHRRSVNHG